VVLITGNKRAVTNEMSQNLATAIVDAGEDSGRIRNEMRLLNRLASRSPAGTDTISDGCTVVSIDASGSGSQDIDPAPGLDLPSVSNGRDFSTTALLSLMGGIENAEIVGAAFGTSKESTTLRSVDCKRSISDPGIRDI
jgi:hypothetical protein